MSLVEVSLSTVVQLNVRSTERVSMARHASTRNRFDALRDDFGSLLERVLPLVNRNRHAFYTMLARCILDPASLSEVRRFDLWRSVEAIDPFGGRG